MKIHGLFPRWFKNPMIFSFTWLEQNEQISLVVFNGCIFFVLILDGSNAFEMMNGSYVVYMCCKYIYIYIQWWLMFWKRLKSNTNCQQNRLTKWTPTSCSCDLTDAKNQCRYPRTKIQHKIFRVEQFPLRAELELDFLYFIWFYFIERRLKQMKFGIVFRLGEAHRSKCALYDAKLPILVSKQLSHCEMI